MDNNTIAQGLREQARLRDAERGNLFRVRAYRRAADLIEEMDQPLTTVYERDGRRGLRSLPGIGRHVALTIESLIQTGKLPPSSAA